jgi:urease accessory protein
LLIERGHYDAEGDVMRARWGLGGASVLGFITASPAPADAEAVRALAAGASSDSELASATIVGDGDALVARYLGRSAERARTFLHDTWRLLRPAVLGRTAVSPRVWAT